MVFTTVRVERPEGVVVARGVAALVESAANTPAARRLNLMALAPRSRADLVNAGRAADPLATARHTLRRSEQ